MPIFEYECSKCKTKFELLVSGESSQPIECPECASKKVVRLFSCFSVGTDKVPNSGNSVTSGACSTCTTKNCSSCG